MHATGETIKVKSANVHENGIETIKPDEMLNGGYAMPKPKLVRKHGKSRSQRLLEKRTLKEKQLALEKFINKGEKLPEERLEELDQHAPERVCYVCERTGRDLVMIGPTKHRCHGCSPGSLNWLDYYERLEEAKKTDAGNILYHTKRIL